MPGDIDLQKLLGGYQRGWADGYEAGLIHARTQARIDENVRLIKDRDALLDRLAPYRVHESDPSARLPTIHPADLMSGGEVPIYDPPIEPHYVNKDEIEADGWHCFKCGESIDFDGGDPFHDDPALNPQ